MLFMPSVPTEDPEVPTIQAIAILLPSWVEEVGLAQIHLAREHRPMSKDHAIEPAASVVSLKAVGDS